MNTPGSAITERFLKKGKPLFIPFITTGDPSPELSVEIMLALEEAGADMIELGVPFSDPLADGPTIQRATMRALGQGITMAGVLQTAAKARKAGVRVPLILFTYYNPVLQYGMDRLFVDMALHGINGIIIPDLPMEESNEVKKAAAIHDIPLISLVAPTSEQRIRAISSQAEGFIYCVSSLGVTGVRNELDHRLEDMLQQVKQYSRVPVVVGFGISTPQQVSALAARCNGVVVGSAIVNMIEKYQEQLLSDNQKKIAISAIKTFVKSLQSGLI